MIDRTHQFIYDRIDKLEARIQEIEETIDLLGSTVVILIKKVDPDFGASDEL